MRKRNFPDLLEAWMEYNRHSIAPKIYQRWSFVSVIAGALERKVWLTKNHHTGWYPNLYLFLVGPPGSGKSVTAEAAMSLLQEVPGIEFLADQVNAVSLFHDLSAIGRKKIFRWNGEAYPHSAATIFASEAATTFIEQYKGGGIITALTNLYNGGPLGWSMRHGVSRSTRGDGSVACYNPCINLLACSTPAWLMTRCMTRDDAEGGFGSRILIVVNYDELVDDGVWDSGEIASDMKLRMAIIEDLKQVAKLAGPYSSDLSFRAAWQEVTKRHNAEMEVRARSGVLGGYQQRKLTQLIKLTMILAASRRNDLVVTGKDLEDAWTMLAQIEPDMVMMLEELDMSPDSKARRDIFNWLRAVGHRTVTKATIMHAFPRMDWTQFNQAIAGLLAMRRLRVIKESPAEGVLYQVNHEG